MNSTPNLYNFPILNKPQIIPSNSNPLLQENNGNLNINSNSNNSLSNSSNAATVGSLNNKSLNSLNLNTFVKDYRNFEEKNLDESLINININRREYQPSENKKPQRQISQLYILPELYILYSKIYSSFFLRQNYTFDFLNTYDDFYRMTQYDYAHDNPNIISINELFKKTSDKKINNNMMQLVDDFKIIVENIKGYGNDTNTIIQNINDFMTVMKRILEKKYNNQKTLVLKIKLLIQNLKKIFSDNDFDKYFRTSMSSSNSIITKIKDINISTNNNNDSNEIIYSSINSLIESMNRDLENLSGTFYNSSSNKSLNSSKKQKQNTFRSQLNTIIKLFEEIQFLYFQTNYKNLSSYQESLLKIKNNDSELTKINEFIQKIQQISILLRSENSSVDSLLKSLSEYIEILSRKDEDLKSELNKKKESIDNLLSLRRVLIDNIDDIINSFNSLNKINKNKESTFKFITEWFKLLKSIKCKELNCIYVLLNNKDEIEKCKDAIKIEKNNRDQFKNEVTTSFSNIRTYFKTISDSIKNKIKELDSDLNEIKQQLPELQKLSQTFENELKPLRTETSSLKSRKTSMKDPVLSSSNRQGKTTSEIKQLTEELKQAEIEKIDEQLKPKIIRERELETQKILSDQKYILLKDKESFLTQSINTLKQLEQNISQDANEFVVDKMKVLVENVFNIFTIYARIYALSNKLILNKEKKTTSKNPAIEFFDKDTLFSTMKKLLDIQPIMNRRANRPEAENRTKTGLRRYRLRVNRSIDNFKKVLIPRILQYYQEKENYFVQQDSILAAFSLNIASLVPKMNESSYKNLNSDSLSLGPLVNRFNFSNNLTTSTSSSSSSSKTSTYNKTSSSPIQQSRYGMAYGGANATNVKKPNIKNPINIYSEYCGKILQELTNKISSNINYLNRVNTFKIMFNNLDKKISQKIFNHLTLIYNSKNIEYNFPFAEQVRFIVLRYSKVLQFLKNIKNNYNSNSNFNFMQNYYLTDFFYMYLVLQLTFYNFILCIQPKLTSKSINY